MSSESDSSSERLLSPAVRSGIVGGLLVGTTTAIIAFAFIGPLRHYGFDFVDTLFVALIGAMFGVIAGAVAGAGEADEHPAVPTSKVLKAKPAKPSMTHVHRAA